MVVLNLFKGCALLGFPTARFIFHYFSHSHPVKMAPKDATKAPAKKVGFFSDIDLVVSPSHRTTCCAACSNMKFIYYTKVW